MQDFSVMQCFQASDNLNENIPNLLFLDVGFSLLVAANLLEDITIVSMYPKCLRPMVVCNKEYDAVVCKQNSMHMYNISLRILS